MRDAYLVELNANKLRLQVPRTQVTVRQ